MTYCPYRVSATVKTLYGSYEGELVVHARSYDDAKDRAERELRKQYKTPNVDIKSVCKMNKETA